MTTTARTKRQRAAAKRGHWPKPNGARTHCLECGRLIARSGRGWVHRRRPGAGRPRAQIRERHRAARAAEDWHDCNQIAEVYCRLRDEALHEMVRSGALVRHIAELTGMSIPLVRYHLERCAIPIPVLPRHTAPPSRSMLDRLAKG